MADSGYINVSFDYNRIKLSDESTRKKHALSLSLSAKYQSLAVFPKSDPCGFIQTKIENICSVCSLNQDDAIMLQNVPDW